MEVGPGDTIICALEREHLQVVSAEDESDGGAILVQYWSWVAWHNNDKDTIGIAYFAIMFIKNYYCNLRKYILCG